MNYNNLFKYINKITVTLAFLILLYLILLYRFYYLFNNKESLWLTIYSTCTAFFLLTRILVAFFYEDQHSRKLRAKYPTVSFVISCKNEEDSIAQTISACLHSEYPAPFNCIAIDDGSTDNTWKEMKKAKRIFGKQLQLIQFKHNLGKREGMAAGVRASNNEIVVFVDSDSFVKADAVRIMVEHFMVDNRLGAISGNTQVHNIDANLLTKMQSARYGVAFDIFKAAESTFGCVTCCPGCFSAYRRSAILEVIDNWLNQSFLGSKSTFGDDRSLTNFVMRKWQIMYCRHAVATTIVPENYSKFFKQQLRWKKSWIREGFFNAGKIMWRKHIIASTAFYINITLPILGPIILFKTLFWNPLLLHQFPLFFLVGIIAMSTMFGLNYYLVSTNKHWWHVIGFSLLYTFVLVWQMPYALLTIRNTKWGTR